MATIWESILILIFLSLLLTIYFQIGLYKFKNTTYHFETGNHKKITQITLTYVNRRLVKGNHFHVRFLPPSRIGYVLFAWEAKLCLQVLSSRG